MNVLFLCVGNSARSQIAEALAQSLFGPNVKARSAGTFPTSIDPLAVKVMNEIGLDISENRAKSFDHLSAHFIQNLDYVFVLCQEIIMPVMTSPEARVFHWPMQDPQRLEGDETKLAALRALRDDLKSRLENFAKEVKIPNDHFEMTTV